MSETNESKATKEAIKALSQAQFEARMALKKDWKEKIKSLPPEEQKSAKKQANDAYMQQIQDDEVALKQLKASLIPAVAERLEKKAAKQDLEDSKTEIRVERLLADLRSNLAPEEKIVSYVEASSLEPVALGLLALTNIRVRFCFQLDRHGKKIHHEDFFLTDIHNVSHNLRDGGFRGGRLWVRSGKETRYFKAQISHQSEFNEFAHTLSSEVMKTKTSGSPITPNHTELSEELNKLHELHKAGVLTSDEFAAAKSKLLGI